MWKYVENNVGDMWIVEEPLSGARTVGDPVLLLSFSSSLRVNLRVLQCFHLKGSQSPEILIANGKPSEIPFQSNLIET